MADSAQPKLCRLHGVLGRVVVCPGAACPLWDVSISLGGGCAVEELDLAGRPALAGLLLGVRGQLETVRTLEEEDRARDEICHLLATRRRRRLRDGWAPSAVQRKDWALMRRARSPTSR